MECIESAIANAIRCRPYNALITETFDLARKQAKNAIQRGLNPFPIVIKDCFMTTGTKTTCASRTLSNFIAPYSATAVQKLYDNGGCLIGKANMDEFSMGTSSSHSFYGPVKNGFSDKHCLETDWLSPGGSSGGSAVAVQLDIASIGLGSDTGGSSRNPAAFTGVFGFKPSYGTVSRHGLVPLVNSLDCPSINAKSVRDCNSCFEIISGSDPNDCTSIQAPSSCFMDNGSLSGLTVGIPREYFNGNLSADSWRAWNMATKVLSKLGLQIKEVRMPHTEHSFPCYHVLAEAEIASNMARYDGVKYGHRASCSATTSAMFSASRSESLNETVRRRIFAGNYFLMKSNFKDYFRRALQVRRLIKIDFDRVFRAEGCHILLTPVACGVAPRFSEISTVSGYVREGLDDFYTQPSNMAGVPAVSVPLMRSDSNLPVAVQIISDYLKDGIALSVANALYHFVTHE